MVQIYLTGAISSYDDPFEWHDELANSDDYSEHTFINPYTLNDFDLGDSSIYDHPDRIVEPALEEIENSDGMLVRWDDDAFLIGSAMETLYAFLNDVPVVIWYDGYRDNLSPWLLHTSRGSFEEKERALDILLGFCDGGFQFSK